MPLIFQCDRCGLQSANCHHITLVQKIEMPGPALDIVRQFGERTEWILCATCARDVRELVGRVPGHRL